MSLSSLPLECLQYILRILQQQKGRTSLSRLLCTNSYFYHAALPYLYDGVFHLDTCRSARTCPRAVKIVRTLLSQLPPADVSNLLKATYGLLPQRPENKRDATPDSSVAEDRMNVDLDKKDTRVQGTNYVSLIYFFDLESVVYAPIYSFRELVTRWTEYPSLLAGYVFRSKTGQVADGLGDGCHDEELHFPPELMTRYWPISDLRYGALSAALRRDLTWTLCSPVFENIRSLTIPLSDIDRYFDVVDRFQSLIIITFLPDDLLEVPPRVLRGFEQLHEECQRKRAQQYRTMIAFVQRHVQLFPNLLQDTSCPINYGWPEVQKIPSEIDVELKSELPPLIKPTVIDCSNCCRLWRNIKSTDLGLVESVSLEGTFGRMELEKLLEVEPSFLQRCRRLKTLSLSSFVPELLQWALKEKQAWDRQSSAAATGYVRSQDIAEQGQPLLDLIPLQSVSLSTEGVFRNELDDILTSFGTTLSEFYAYARMSGSDSGQEMYIGRGWELPEMKRFTIVVQHIHLKLDPCLFSSGFGQKLQRIELADKSGFYHPGEIESCLPAFKTLPDLTDIELQGWPALSFHPDTFHSSPHLKSLRLGLFGYQAQTFIPPVEELEASFQDQGAMPARPLWTWNWQLPHLQSLKLTSEFAFRFQFRMLEGCPSLEHLSLNICTDEQLHERRLTIEEFRRRSYLEEQDESDGGSDDHFIVAPLVRSLHLFGQWVIEDAVLEVIYGITFPGVAFLIEHEVKGYSLAHWLRTLRQSSTLKEASCGLDSRQPSESELRNIGLVAVQALSPNTINGERVELRKEMVFSIGYGHWSFAEDMEKAEEEKE